MTGRAALHRGYDLLSRYLFYIIEYEPDSNAVDRLEPEVSIQCLQYEFGNDGEFISDSCPLKGETPFL